MPLRIPFDQKSPYVVSYNESIVPKNASGKARRVFSSPSDDEQRYLESRAIS
jgi:hypothetical protein